MKLRHWLRYKFLHDTTWHGQFAALGRLLLKRPVIEPVVVDVGAHDGFFSSNSYPFIKRGWRALLIEPHPGAFEKAQQLHRNHPSVTVLNLACSDHEGREELNLFQGDEAGSLSALSGAGAVTASKRGIARAITVQVTVLEALLRHHRIPERFGLLTVDTEGQDFAVLRGLNLSHFRPRAIITEKYNDDTSKFDHLQKHGYQLYADLEHDTVWTVLEV
ncbi:MAG: FkbM family methyltransferase [Verrucomicrobiae bacterium]|nr:FkbM family methyltransferase [Verrucomicrobiae bacterium]